MAGSEKERHSSGHTSHKLSHAFRTWFRDTEEDGTPLLPHQLSQKYNVRPKILGQGSFAVVKLVADKQTGEQRALKIIAKKPLKDNNEKMLKEEINILGKVDHPNILKMHDLYETKEGVFIVTDYCEGGELFDRLVEKVHFNELDARHVVKQIFSGVEYLHKIGIIHRDLKPENILLKDKADPSDIVISDFGLSRFIPADGLLMTACGSPQYVSPEVLLGKGYGPAVDIWSSGVITYCLLAGYTPFYGEDQPSLFRQIVEMRVEFEPKYWSEISDIAKDFICKCLCPAEKRLTAAQALQHPWLTNLPELHDEKAERGACLKECAKRHGEKAAAKKKLGRAITAMEVVAYLNKLHSLREGHHEVLPSESLENLRGIVDSIKRHRRGPSLPHGDDEIDELDEMVEKAKAQVHVQQEQGYHGALPPAHDSGAGRASRAMQGVERDETHATLSPDEASIGAKAPGSKGGSGMMGVDLVVMSVLMPEGWPSLPKETKDGEAISSAASTSSGKDGSNVNAERDSEPVPAPAPAPMMQAELPASAAKALSMVAAESGLADGPNGDDSVEAASVTSSSPAQSTVTLKPSNAQKSKQQLSVSAPLDNRRRSTETAEERLKRQEKHPQRHGSYTPRETSTSTKAALNTLLEPYKKGNLPSSARLDPTVPTRQPTKITLSNAWRYLPFIVHQGVSIGSALASHAFYGPPKKSWGVELSVFTKILRDCAQYSEFATIQGLQQFFDLGSFLPMPKDGLITPVTFRVNKRGLKGFLAEADAAEDGTREITGEWVVGKHTWKRLQAEWRSKQEKGRERVILYFHGGAYFVMSAATHRPLTIALSKYTDCRVFGINYRLAPDTKFPGALHDCVSSYFRLVDELGIPPNNIVLGADSAGGGLAMATMLYLRDHGYPLPSGAMLFSPWVDLTMSCDSWDTNAQYDYLPRPAPGDHMNPVTAYLGQNIDKYLTHPYASPLFGDMKGLPPLLIQCGDAEVLRDEGTLLAHKASMAGVSVRHEMYEDCVHVFQAFLFLDASRKALQSARHFVRTALDRRGRTRSHVSDKVRKEIDREMRVNMSTAKGERVEPRTGEKEGPVTSVSDPEDRDSDRDDEQWELDHEAAAESSSAGTGPSVGAAAGRAARRAFGMAEKAFGIDNQAVTDMTSRGAGQHDARRSSPRPEPQCSRTQPSSPVTHRTLYPFQAGAGAGKGPAAGTAPPSTDSSRHRHTSSSSSSSMSATYMRRATPSMSLEEARASASAGIRAQHLHGSKGHHAAGKFLEGKVPPVISKPRLSTRSTSNLALDQLVKSFEREPAVKTARWTAD
ncbi:Pkinase-domain-containing protein [Tilletiaria anomala UBC 951]|uniref:Pkinase-domain-containing protein n=1 Tax=Tilletiaria anomala (strain ATCC 24038 / CBS 436.72 / UBC 951) TaxID=1037660 RepID=A0A066WF35_TILAU|nr:Pkinase-domain-containing protein [Tilletiaria anomala UBC 951]KDN52592.1 Pkinase-domain-containing protein [Tilletiaria anomala UBC 951]